MTVKSFTRAEYEALGVEAPWVPPFALENRGARDRGGTGHYYASRGTAILGICLHGTAGITDLVAPDTSAEATTNYGRTTTTPASWTGIVDSDSIINSLHPDRVGFVQGVSGYNFNRPLMGLEIGKRDMDWTVRSVPDWWVAATLQNAAAYCAPFVVKYGIPLRVLTNRDEIQRLIDAGQPVGFCEHWHLTPTTRTDVGRIGAGTTFPWARFFDYLRVAIARIGGTVAARRYPTTKDFYDLAADLADRGWDITCGPTHVDRGYCAPGKHPHMKGSPHFRRAAVDASWPGPPISDIEALHAELLVEELLRDPHIIWRCVWNWGPGDHEDHPHIDDMKRHGWKDAVRPRAGVRARDGVDLFVSPKAFPNHVPPRNHGYSLAHMVLAQQLLSKMVDPATGVPLLRANHDGYYGPLLEAATGAAQRILGFPAAEQDGIPGPATVRAIREHLGGTTATTPQPNDTDRAVQQLLADLGYDLGKHGVDGWWGADSTRAATLYATDYGFTGTFATDRTTLHNHLEESMTNILTALADVKAQLEDLPRRTAEHPYVHNGSATQFANYSALANRRAWQNGVLLAELRELLHEREGLDPDAIGRVLADQLRGDVLAALQGLEVGGGATPEAVADAVVTRLADTLSGAGTEQPTEEPA